MGEIWDIIGPQIEHVMSGCGATWNENQLVPITRDGVREDVYWTYSYSPIDDQNAANGVGGVLVVCSETTQQVLAARELEAETSDFADVRSGAGLHGPAQRSRSYLPGRPIRPTCS